MNKEILLFILMSLFLINLTSALDEEIYIPCGGDDELVIGCPIGDEEIQHIFGRNVTEEEITEEKEGTNPKFFAPIKGFVKEYFLYLLLIFMSFFMILMFYLIIYKKRENKK